MSNIIPEFVYPIHGLLKVALWLQCDRVDNLLRTIIVVFLWVAETSVIHFARTWRPNVEFASVFSEKGVGEKTTSALARIGYDN